MALKPRVLVNACGAKSGGARQMLAMLVRRAPEGRYVVACPNPGACLDT